MVNDSRIAFSRVGPDRAGPFVNKGDAKKSAENKKACFSFLTKEAIYGLDRTVPSSQNLKVKCKAATLGSNALKTRSNTVGISKTQNADRTAHTEHIE